MYVTYPLTMQFLMFLIFMLLVYYSHCKHSENISHLQRNHNVNKDTIIEKHIFKNEHDREISKQHIKNKLNEKKYKKSDIIKGKTLNQILNIISIDPNAIHNTKNASHFYDNHLVDEDIDLRVGLGDVANRLIIGTEPATVMTPKILETENGVSKSNVTYTATQHGTQVIPNELRLRSKPIERIDDNKSNTDTDQKTPTPLFIDPSKLESLPIDPDSQPNDLSAGLNDGGMVLAKDGNSAQLDNLISEKDEFATTPEKVSKLVVVPLPNNPNNLVTLQVNSDEGSEEDSDEESKPIPLQTALRGIDENQPPVRGVDVKDEVPVDETKGKKIPSTDKLIKKFKKWAKKYVKSNQGIKLSKIKSLTDSFKEWLEKVIAGNYVSSDEPDAYSDFDTFLADDDTVDEIEADGETNKEVIIDWIDHYNISLNSTLKNNFYGWLHNSSTNYITNVEEWLANATRDEQSSINNTQEWVWNQAEHAREATNNLTTIFVEHPYHVRYPPNHILFDYHKPMDDQIPTYHHVHHHHGHVHHFYDYLHENRTRDVNHIVTTMHPCHNGGILVPLGMGDYQCICKKGYLGAICEEIDYCSCKHNQTCPCQNKGICNPIEISPRYFCTCPKTFYGKHCEKRNPCEPNICLNGGHCSHDGNGATQCICKKGFMGKFCQNLDSCVPDPCKNSGTCSQQDGNGKFLCSCTDLFKGTLCTLPRYCTSNPCQNGGTCQETNDDFYCICREGFIGKTCNARSCLPNPCYIGSTCIENGSTYKCLCSPWTSGVNCSLVSPCKLNPCRSNGQCIDILSGFKWAFKPMQYYCLCRPPYMGPQCTDNMCNHCSPYGHCNNESRCVCDQGYYGNGYICEEESYDPCEPNPCEHNGICINEKNGDFHCICPRPYQPPRCTVSDVCNPDPCHNGQCMVVSSHIFKCICDQGYRGSRCNITDPCQPNPCLHNGACFVANRTANCSCLGNWTGPTCGKCSCSISTVHRNSNDDRNAGLELGPAPFCNKDDGKCMCANMTDISYRYERGKCVKEAKALKETATTCEIEKPCKNGGTCSDITESPGYTCKCSKWFFGQKCEILKECVPENPCLNNGVCDENGPLPYKCKCPPGTTGRRCDALPTVAPIILPHCLSGICANGGSCHELEKGYDCHCLPRFTGSNCDIDRCADCDAEAHCYLGHCYCNVGFIGNGYECIKDVSTKCGKCAPTLICIHHTGQCDCQPGYTYINDICIPMHTSVEEEMVHSTSHPHTYKTSHTNKPGNGQPEITTLTPTHPPTPLPLTTLSASKSPETARPLVPVTPVPVTETTSTPVVPVETTLPPTGNNGPPPLPPGTTDENVIVAPSIPNANSPSLGADPSAPPPAAHKKQNVHRKYHHIKSTLENIEKHDQSKVKGFVNIPAKPEFLKHTSFLFQKKHHIHKHKVNGLPAAFSGSPRASIEPSTAFNGPPSAPISLVETYEDDMVPPIPPPHYVPEIIAGPAGTSVEEHTVEPHRSYFRSKKKRKNISRDKNSETLLMK